MIHRKETNLRHNHIFNFIKYYFRGKKYPLKTKELIEKNFYEELEAV